jgi:hypothetical protein
MVGGEGELVESSMTISFTVYSPWWGKRELCLACSPTLATLRMITLIVATLTLGETRGLPHQINRSRSTDRRGRGNELCYDAASSVFSCAGLQPPTCLAASMSCTKVPRPTRSAVSCCGGSREIRPALKSAPINSGQQPLTQTALRQALPAKSSQASPRLISSWFDGWLPSLA